jgi:hypothetical protein
MNIVTSFGNELNDLSIDAIDVAAYLAERLAACAMVDGRASPQCRAVGGWLLGIGRTGEQTARQRSQYFDPHCRLLVRTSYSVFERSGYRFAWRKRVKTKD